MPIRQTRVFVPSNEPETDWAETLIGRVFRPLAEEFAGVLEWSWFSRYACLENLDSGDCQIASIPDEFKLVLEPGGPRFHRSMRFRFNVTDDSQAIFERRAQELINTHGYHVSDFRGYNFVDDTGSDRFLGTENRQPGRAEHRAVLATNFYSAISRLVIDALVGPDKNGRFQMEQNDEPNNPDGSTFQSLLHLFCNMTNVPTSVYVFKGKADKIGLSASPYNAPPAPPEGWNPEVIRCAIRF